MLDDQAVKINAYLFLEISLPCVESIVFIVLKIICFLYLVKPKELRAVKQICKSDLYHLLHIES